MDTEGRAVSFCEYNALVRPRDSWSKFPMFEVIMAAVTAQPVMIPAHSPRIPAAIKWLLGAWLALWLPLHLAAYPASTFLWMCAYGNVLVVLGICLESRLIVSWQAVALLIPQTLYSAEAFARLVTGARGGGTSYLFYAAVPLDVRALSFFHFVVPLLLIWAVRRVGYDPRALPVQLAAAVVVSLASLPVGPINVWCLPLAREHVLAALVLAPLALHVPAHALLLRSGLARCEPVTG